MIIFHLTTEGRARTIYGQVPLVRLEKKESESIGQCRVHSKVLFFTFKAIHGIVLVYIGELVSLKERGVYTILDLLMEHC